MLRGKDILKKRQIDRQHRRQLAAYRRRLQGQARIITEMRIALLEGLDKSAAANRAMSNSLLRVDRIEFFLDHGRR